MLNFCGIVVAILKMETGRNCSMSGINSGHHNLPTYEISLKSNNVEFVWYCGSHLRLVEIFRYQESISDIIIYLHMKCRWNQTLLNLCGIVFRPFRKWRPVEIFQCRDIIIYPHFKFWWYRTMLNFYRPYFMPCFGRDLEHFEHAELLL